MSGSKTISTSATKIEALKFQSSAYGGTIPVIFGQTRVPGNLLWYGGFKAIPHTTTEDAGGKGGSTTIKNTTYTYKAALMMALSESQAVAVVKHWRGKKLIGGLGSLSMASGVLGQSVWSHLTATAPSEALAYSGINYVYSSAYDLGDTASVDNHNFEIQTSSAYQVTVATPDVDPSFVGAAMLTSQQYGVAFPSGLLAPVDDGETSWSNYCRAAGLLLSPAFTEQTDASDMLNQLCRLTNTGVVWSAGLLKFIPYGDVTLTSFGRTYTPNNTPVYDLTDDHFLDKDNPVRLVRKPQSDAHNHIQVEFLDRANEYNIAIVEAKDQANIDLFGLRSASVLKAHWICDAAVARKVAQLLLQRTLYIRNTYEFKLPWNFALLEPMDLVTLTDPVLVLDRLPVRITDIEESEDGELSVKAEDFPLGVANSSTYDVQPPSGFQPNYNAAPGSVSTPVIFELPGAMTVNGLELGVATTGIDANWGGCTMWVSLDGSNYKRATVMSGGSRYGTVFGGAGTSGIIPVQLLKGAMLSGSAADAAAMNTLCFLRNTSGVEEFISYQTATLTAPSRYDLTGTVVRGAYGTDPVTHASGSTFVRMDEAVARSGPIDLVYIGKTIRIKLTSFNVFGGAEQQLSDVPEYTYTITGARLYGNAGASAVAGLGVLASDDVLTAGEKPPVLLEYTAVVTEQSVIDAQASAYGITTEKTAYDNALAALVSYLATLTTPVAWNNLSGNTNITGSTFRTTWAALYAARQTLLSKVDQVAGTRAEWTSVTGTGKPASYATVGKSLGLPFESWNLNGQPLVTVSDGKVGNKVLRLEPTVEYPNQGNYIPIDRSKKYRTRFWARPVAATNGLLYFSLRQYLDAAGTEGPVNGGRSPYKPSGQNRTAHNATFGTDAWGEYSYIWEASDWQAGVQFVQPDFLDNYSGSAGYWEVQDFTFEEVTEVLLAQTTASSALTNAGLAQTAADNAQTTADAANTALAVIANDNVLSKGEKSQVILDYTVITNEQAGIAAQALAYGITTERTNYNSAVSALASYLSGLSPAWNDTTQDTPITGSTFRSNFAEVYYRRQVLLDQIAAVAKSLANTAQTTADNANTAAGNAQTAADNAQTTANNANTAIGVIANDNVLSKGEKGQVIADWTAVSNEQSDIDAKATAYGITTEKTNYDSAVSSLGSYLSGLSPAWNDVSQDTPITGSTFRSYWTAAYYYRQLLLNKIAQVAGTLASWSGITGTGKPADNATADILLVASGTGVVLVGGNGADRTSGGGSWNAGAYSLNGFTGGAYCEFTATTGTSMAGLNSDPTTDDNYTSLDYAFYFTGAPGSSLYIYESGNDRGAFGTFAATDVFAVVYDGATVRYMKNGVVLRTVAAAADQRLYFDSSIVSNGAGFRNIRIAPTSPVTGINTGQIVDSAVSAYATYTGTGDLVCPAC